MAKTLRENPWLTGMTLRDVFAVQIINGMMANGEWMWTGDQTYQANLVWETADLMVAAREGGA
jgi:hypothetical protein